jgi:hypothetical protein
MKPIKIGMDYLRGEGWNRVMAKDRSQALRIGKKVMDAQLKRQGWVAQLFEADEYYRIEYGRKI